MSVAAYHVGVAALAGVVSRLAHHAMTMHNAARCSLATKASAGRRVSNIPSTAGIYIVFKRMYFTMFIYF